MTTARDRRTDPAPAVWAALITAGLGADVYLHRNQHRTLSAIARTPAGWLAHGVLVLHFAGWLGRFDPFHAAASAIPIRGKLVLSTTQLPNRTGQTT